MKLNKSKINTYISNFIVATIIAIPTLLAVAKYNNDVGKQEGFNLAKEKANYVLNLEEITLYNNLKSLEDQAGEFEMGTINMADSTVTNTTLFVTDDSVLIQKYWDSKKSYEHFSQARSKVNDIKFPTQELYFPKYISVR